MNFTTSRSAFCVGLAVLTLTAGIACRDGSAPATDALSGEFTLARVGEKTLPVRGMTYGDASFDELDHGSLTILSRGRLTVMSSTILRNSDSTIVAERVDSLVFEYARSGSIIELKLRDGRGLHMDTLVFQRFSANTALRATSANYAQKGFPAPLVRDGLYIQ